VQSCASAWVRGLDGNLEWPMAMSLRRSTRNSRYRRDFLQPRRDGVFGEVLRQILGIGDLAEDHVTRLDLSLDCTYVVLRCAVADADVDRGLGKGVRVAGATRNKCGCSLASLIRLAATVNPLQVSSWSVSGWRVSSWRRSPGSPCHKR
jgi:hypothetical protein